ncbi:MAG TPA: hypothetical protein VFJ51_02490 [Nitrososphaeraceae archaeon]|nr:hypothetical protein [Nitrososphaeraceae archaeon]
MIVDDEVDVTATLKAGIEDVSNCFMSCAAEINYEVLREVYPISLGCIIRKPVSIDYLVKRIRSELD